MCMNADTMPRALTSPTQNMDAEIAHWRSGYPHCAFFSKSLQFERYLPTFAFAYRTFVSQPEGQSDAVPVRLCSTYKDSVPACDRIDWNEAEMIIGATWQRIRATALAQKTSLDGPVQAPCARRLPLSPDQRHAA